MSSSKQFRETEAATLTVYSPDRWLHELPTAASAVPGVWANLMTFLGGPRSCIGFKFAVLEYVHKTPLGRLLMNSI
jgi:cytochrome P450